MIAPVANRAQKGGARTGWTPVLTEAETDPYTGHGKVVGKEGLCKVEVVSGQPKARCFKPRGEGRGGRS